MSFFYPPLDEATVKSIEIVRQLHAEHPSYWLESPYSGAIEALLKRWFEAVQAPAPAAETPAESPAPAPEDGTARWEFLYNESKTLYTKLKNESTDFTKMDGTEKAAYFRVATSLLDKLITYQERTLNLKQIHDFQMTVLEVMEEVLTPGQRTEVMEKLQTAIQKG